MGTARKYGGLVLALVLWACLGFGCGGISGGGGGAALSGGSEGTVIRGDGSNDIQGSAYTLDDNATIYDNGIVTLSTDFYASTIMGLRGNTLGTPGSLTLTSAQPEQILALNFGLAAVTDDWTITGQGSAGEEGPAATLIGFGNSLLGDSNSINVDFLSTAIGVDLAAQSLAGPVTLDMGDLTFLAGAKLAGTSTYTLGAGSVVIGVDWSATTTTGANSLSLMSGKATASGAAAIGQTNSVANSWASTFSGGHTFTGPISLAGATTLGGDLILNSQDITGAFSFNEDGGANVNLSITGGVANWDLDNDGTVGLSFAETANLVTLDSPGGLIQFQAGIKVDVDKDGNGDLLALDGQLLSYLWAGGNNTMSLTVSGSDSLLRLKTNASGGYMEFRGDDACEVAYGFADTDQCGVIETNSGTAIAIRSLESDGAVGTAISAENMDKDTCTTGTNLGIFDGAGDALSTWLCQGKQLSTAQVRHASAAEVAYQLDAVVNKVAGNVVGIEADFTNTSSPGTFTLFDLQVDSTSVFAVDETGTLTQAADATHTYYGSYGKELDDGAPCTTETIAGASQFTDITATSSGGLLNGMTFASNQLTIAAGADGDYMVTSSVSVDYVGTGTNAYEICLEVGGTVNTNCCGDKTLSASSNLGSVSFSCIVNLNATDTINVSITNNTDADNALACDTTFTAHRM